MNELQSLRDKQKPSVAKTILQTVIVFFYTYSFTIQWIFSSAVIACLVALVYAAVYHGKLIIPFKSLNGKKVNKLFLFMFIPLIYSVLLLCIWGSGDGETITRNLLFFIGYGYVAVIALYNCFDSRDEFFRAIYISTLIQIAIIFLGILSADFANLLSTSIANVGQRTYPFMEMRRNGYYGGIACLTSTGSLQLSLGLIACLYYISNRSKTWIYIASYCFFAIVMCAVARTSVLLIVTGILVFMLFDKSYQNKAKKAKVLRTILILTLFLIAIVFLFGLESFIMEVFLRFNKTFDKGLYDTFFGGYFQTEEGLSGGIPPISLETIIGTGITSGISGNGIRVNADGGFVRMYASLGLIMAVIVYVYIFSFFRIPVKRTTYVGLINILFFVFILIGELKEPFIIFRRYMFVLYMVWLLIDEESINNSCTDTLETNTKSISH